jgi:hypothetical protein
MKRLAFLVEGDGDVLAVPALAGSLLSEFPPELQGQLFPDPQPYRIGGLEGFTGRRLQAEWVRYLKAVWVTRKKPPAMLAVFDGDSAQMEGNPFCAVNAARTLAERGRAAGAGTLFSLAVVFLRQEYESILIAAADQITEIDADVARPANPEDAPRDAKGWLSDHMQGGYDPKRNQLALTRAIGDWEPVRDIHRSFRRFNNALRQLAEAVAGGTYVVTPVPPAPSSPPATPASG